MIWILRLRRWANQREIADVIRERIQNQKDLLALYKRSIASLPGELVDLIPNIRLELAQVTETDPATCSAKVDVKPMDLSMLVEMVSRTIVG